MFRGRSVPPGVIVKLAGIRTSRTPGGGLVGVVLGGAPWGVLTEGVGLAAPLEAVEFDVGGEA